MHEKNKIDQWTLEKLKNGDHRIFTELFEKYAPIFRRISYRYTQNHEQSNDVVQESFVKIFNHLPSFSGAGDFEGWMKRIVVNCSLDHLKREKRYLFTEEGVITKSMQTCSDLPLSELGMQEIIELIDQLPTGMKTVFNLNVFGGFSHKEIGNLLKTSDSASRAQLAKAKMKLRSALEKRNKFILNVK